VAIASGPSTVSEFHPRSVVPTFLNIKSLGPEVATGGTCQSHCSPWTASPMSPDRNLSQMAAVSISPTRPCRIIASNIIPQHCLGRISKQTLQDPNPPHDTSLLSLLECSDVTLTWILKSMFATKPLARSLSFVPNLASFISHGWREPGPRPSWTGLVSLPRQTSLRQRLRSRGSCSSRNSLLTTCPVQGSNETAEQILGLEFKVMLGTETTGILQANWLEWQ